MTSPALAIMFETVSGTNPKWALPTPNKIPATGKTETGSINDLPIF